MINNIYHWLVTCFVPFTLYMTPKNPRHPEKLNNFSKVHGKYMEELGFQLPEGRRVRGQESVQFEFAPLSRNFPIVSTYISLTRTCHGADSILKEIWKMWLLWSLSLTPQNTQEMKLGTEVTVPTSSVWLTDKKKANMTRQKENPQLTTNTTLGPSVREFYWRTLPPDQPHGSFWLSWAQGRPLITLLHLLDGPSCVIQGGQENNRVSRTFQTLCNSLAMLPWRQLF